MTAREPVDTAGIEEIKTDTSIKSQDIQSDTETVQKEHLQELTEQFYKAETNEERTLIRKEAKEHYDKTNKEAIQRQDDYDRAQISQLPSRSSNSQ